MGRNNEVMIGGLVATTPDRKRVIRGIGLYYHY